jgi:hypothetical protein
MAGKDIIVASQRELKRLHIVQKVFEGSLKQTEAAEILSLSTLVHKFGHVFLGYAANGKDAVLSLLIFLSNLPRSCFVNFHSNGAAIFS